MTKVRLYRTKCIGCNYCVELAPAYWEMNESDGKVDLLNSDEQNSVFEVIITSDDIDIMNDCVSVCPTKAIRVE